MSLLWTIQNWGAEGLLGQGYSSDTKSVYALMDWFQRQVDAVYKEYVHTVCASEIAADLLPSGSADRLYDDKRYYQQGGAQYCI